MNDPDILQNKIDQLIQEIQELRQENITLSNVIDSLPQRIFWKDLKGNFLGCNRAFLRDAEISKEKIIGHPHNDFICKAYIESYDALEAELMNNKNTLHDNEELIQDEDGNVRWIKTTKSPLISDNETVIGLVGVYTDITRRVEMVNELKLKIRRDFMIFERLPFMVLAIDVDNKLMIWNVECEKVSGYSFYDLEKDNPAFLSLFPELESVLSSVDNMSENQSEFLLQLRCKDGTTKYLEWTNLSLDYSIEGIRLLLSGREITNLNADDAKLIQSNKLLGLIFNSMPVGVGITDNENKYIELNKAFCQISGYFKHELLGTNDIIKKLQQSKISQNKQTNSAIYKIKNKYGRVLITEIFESILSNEKGEIIKATIINDITQKHNAQIFNGFMANIVNEIEDIASVKDLNLNVIAANQSFIKVARCKKIDEVIGKNDAEIFGKFVDPQTVHRYMVDEIDAQKLKSGECLLREEPIVYPDGSIGMIQTKKFPIFDENEKIIATASVARDITSFKEIEEKLLRLNQDLEEKVIERTQELEEEIQFRIKNEAELQNAKELAEESDTLKSSFLANMSHEIRTPMNAIIGFSNLLQYDDITPEEKNQYIDLINRSGQNLLNLLNDIFDLSKIEAGFIEIKNSPVSLHEIFRELYFTFEEEKLRQELYYLEFRLDVPDSKDKLIIYTDPFRLKQIMTNLLSNAFKFTDRGYIELGYYQEKESCVTLFVRDTGIGIPSEKYSYIFDRFSKIENDRNRPIGGTGLGLAISKKLAELLGGKLWVESEISKGSVFYVSLPYHKNLSSIHNKTENPNENNFNFEDKSVLIVEDIDSNFIYLASIPLNPQDNL